MRFTFICDSIIEADAQWIFGGQYSSLFSAASIVIILIIFSSRRIRIWVNLYVGFYSTTRVGSLLTNDRYDGGVIVSRSILLGEPVVYVSMNYRFVQPHLSGEYRYLPVQYLGYLVRVVLLSIKRDKFNSMHSLRIFARPRSQGCWRRKFRLARPYVPPRTSFAKT